MNVDDPGRSTVGRFALPPAIDQEVRVTYRYPVRFTRRLLNLENRILRDVVTGDCSRPLLFVIDAGVVDHHPTLLDDIQKYCVAHGLELAGDPLVVPGGEAVKQDPAIVDEVRDAIDARGVCRHSYVVGVGGGAVLDMAGFAAATAHRGVRLVRVPTTVLAQNDSAVGVKNGINAYGKKNFLGSFAPPWAVLCDFDFLTTLSDRDWRAGMAEAVKVASVKGRRVLRVDRAPRRRPRRARSGGDGMADSSLCEASPRAHRDERRSVRVGVLAATGLRALGGSQARAAFALRASPRRGGERRHRAGLHVRELSGMLPDPDWSRVLALLSAVGLPLYAPELLLASEGRRLVLAGRDEFREHLGGRLTVMLLERIGVGREVHHLDDRVLLAAVDLLGELEAESARAARPGQLPARAA